MNSDVIKRYADAAKQICPDNPSEFCRKMAEDQNTAWNKAANILEVRGCIDVAKEEVNKAIDEICSPQKLEYTGDICPSCKSPNMIKTGSCSTCQNCGDTSGCG